MSRLKMNIAAICLGLATWSAGLLTPHMATAADQKIPVIPAVMRSTTTAQPQTHQGNATTIQTVGWRRGWAGPGVGIGVYRGGWGPRVGVYAGPRIYGPRYYRPYYGAYATPYYASPYYGGYVTPGYGGYGYGYAPYGVYRYQW
jgi:hypothetical protein